MDHSRVRDTTSRSTRWTYAEFARLPSDGTQRHEIIAGDLVVTPAPRPDHQRVVARIIAALHDYLHSYGLGEVLPGPVDVLFAEGDYYEPDAVVVLKGRSHIVTDRGLEGPPDLVVEVASPATEARDRGIKLDRYRLFEVPEYWILDPDTATLLIWRFGEGATEPVVLGEEDVLEWRPHGSNAEGASAAPPVRLRVASFFES